jgi:hypothetical protein
MHDCADGASDALVDDFRTAEPAMAMPRSQRRGQGSNHDQMKRGSVDHDAGALNEGRCP